MLEISGDIRYNEWTCTSHQCNELFNKSERYESFYTQQVICDNNLVTGDDFDWTTTRKTYSIEWGLYCGNEVKNTMITSVFLIGALIGMLASTAIYDRIGRKNGAIIGALIATVSVLMSALAPDYEVMLISRIAAGFGVVIQFMGFLCWVLEFCPESLRNLAVLFIMLGWAFSYFILIAISYFVHEWRHIYFSLAGMSAITLVPLVTLPESPRFHLVQGKDKEAKKTLELLAQVAGSKISIENIDLVYTIKTHTIIEQIKDFKAYPIMLKETLVTMFTWFLTSLVMYGYHFGWGKLSNNIYIAYAAAASSEVILPLATVPIVDYLGRKYAVVFFLISTITCNLVAMVNYQFKENWSVELLASLVGSMAITGAYNVMFLLTVERAPTSHCGMILSLGNGMARAGAIFSPHINLLYGITSRRVPLAIYAGIALLSLIGISVLSDTTGQAIPETPAQMRTRRNIVGTGDTDKENSAEKIVISENPEAFKYGTTTIQ